MSENLDVSMKCVQYMLFVSNFLFVMIGLLLISIGTIIKTMYIDFEYFLDSAYFSPSDIVIFSGFVIFLVAFFGCWGAIRESTLLVNLYALFLFVILILELIAAVIAITMRFNLNSSVSNNMENTFMKLKNDSIYVDVFDFTQSQLWCCGVHDMKDWMIYYTYPNVPNSCCSGYDYFKKDSNITCKIGSPQVYKVPCANQVTDLISQTSGLLTSGALCVAFIQIIGIIFARLLSKTIRNLKSQRLVEAELRRQQIYSQIILGVGASEDRPHNTTASEA